MTQSPRDERKPDRLHELQLMRDLEIVNERTMRELGPLPAGGLPVVPKRKPDLSRTVAPPTVPEPPAFETATSGASPLGTAPSAVEAEPALAAPPVAKPVRSAPPLPQRLRDMLADHPEHIRALQYALNQVATGEASDPTLFDQAVAALDTVLESFVEDARMELLDAEKTNNAAAIAQAEEKELLMSRAKFKHRWLGDEPFRTFFGADR